MPDTTELKCSKCGTPLVEVKGIALDGTLPLDGSWNLDTQSVCPQCHPELVKEA